MSQDQLKQMIIAMMAGDEADIRVMAEIEGQQQKSWKRYAQAFTGLDAVDLAELDR